MKKVIAFLTALAFLAMPSALAAPAKWAEREISPALYAACEMDGEKDYSAPVSREFMARIMLFAYIEGGGEFEFVSEKTSPGFLDPYAETAAVLGLTEELASIESETGLTRLEVVRCIYAMANEFYYLNEEDKEGFMFTAAMNEQTSDLSGTDAEAVGCALEWWIIQGNEKGDLNLNELCSVEQALVILSRGLLND